MNVNTEVKVVSEKITTLKVTGSKFEVRAGTALTTIELTNNGKGCGRDLVFRTASEIPELIEALMQVNEYFNNRNKEPNE